MFGVEAHMASRTRSSSIGLLSRLCVRPRFCWSMFSLVSSLPSTTSAGGLPLLFSCFAGLGSEVAHSVARVLATVRRSNGVCSFPAPRFHEDSLHRAAREGINRTKFTSPYSLYRVVAGNDFQP